ncbi:MAG: hypothetical protein M3Q30_05505 [Actinomycetota bacterium]|nr:hypothetical protein [Actinomycetota bacterium]
MTVALPTRWGLKKWGRPIQIALLATVLFAVGAAPRVADAGVQNSGKFQLDGNTLPRNCPPNDWAGLYTVGGATPCGSDGFSFVQDPVTSDTTYWSGGGSKDAYDPAVGPWQWSPSDVAPDKDELVDGFAAAYHVTDATSTTRYLFFGSDRFANNGESQQGFWFLRSRVCMAGPVGNPAVAGNCPASTPNQAAHAGGFVDPTTGVPVHHQNGDVLVLANFSSGGTLGSAGVFVWEGADGAGGGSAVQQVYGDTANCGTLANPDAKFCAISNTSALANEPVWPYLNKAGSNSYGESEFVEGGINLSEIPGAGTCFPTFIAETRSSSGPGTGISLQAQLKDLIFGQFQTCNSSTVTTPKDASGINTVSSVSVGTGNSGVDVRDQATVTVTGVDSFAGSVTFHLCGPSASSTATCDTGGVLVGSTPVNSPSPATVLSDTAHITEAGRYCWRGNYSGDTATGVPASSDHSSRECFVVTPVTPTLTTQAVDADGIPLPISAKVPFGSLVYDTATLSGTAYRPGTGGPAGFDGSINPTARTTKAQGSITFTLFGPGSCTRLATGFPASGITRSVNGDGMYGPVSFEPAAPGVYHWKAKYGGDPPNTNASEHNTLCNDTNEDVTVEQQLTTTTTRQFVFPQDKTRIALVSPATGTLTGNVTFQLYDTFANCQAGDPGLPGGATGRLYSEGPLQVSGASPQTKTTNNTTFPVISSRTVYWRVTYESTVQAQKGSSSVCTESTLTTFAGNDGTIAIP